jgi:hypothetical protein
MLGAACWLWIRIALDHDHRPIGRGLVTLLLANCFLVLGGMSTAVGRSPMYPVSEALTSRYNTPAWYLFVVVFLLYFHVAERTGVPTRRRTAQAFWLVAVLALTNSIFGPVYFVHSLEWAAQLAGPESAMAIEAPDYAMWSRTTGPLALDFIKPAEHYVVTHRLGVAADRRLAALGLPLARDFPASSGTVDFGGVGHLDQVETIPGLDCIYVHVRGWAATGVPSAPIEEVLVCDESSTVRGVIHRRQYRPDVPHSLTHSPLPMVGWEGYAKVPPNCRSVSLFFRIHGCPSPVFFQVAALGGR